MKRKKVKNGRKEGDSFIYLEVPGPFSCSDYSIKYNFLGV